MEKTEKLTFAEEKALVHAMLQVLLPLTAVVGTAYTAILVGFSLLAS